MKRFTIINRRQQKKAMKVMRALTHPLRIEILHYLMAQQHGASVTQIYKALDLDQTVASQQLRILREVGLVYRVRIKAWHYYHAESEWIEAIGKAVRKYG